MAEGSKVGGGARRRGVVMVVVAVAVTGLGLGLGLGLGRPRPAGAEATLTVYIRAEAFDPQIASVVPGTTVVWVNQTGSVRTVVAADGSFDSGSLAPGAVFQFTFNEQRTVAYASPQAPGVTGTVVVQAAAAPAPVAPAVPAPAVPAPAPSDLAYTGSATTVNGIVGGLVLALGVALWASARRFGPAAAFSGLPYVMVPDNLLPGRAARRARRQQVRRRWARVR